MTNGLMQKDGRNADEALWIGKRKRWKRAFYMYPDPRIGAL